MTKTIYVDHLTVWTLVYVLLRNPGLGLTWWRECRIWFITASRWGGVLGNLLARTVRMRSQEMDYALDEIRDEEGIIVYLRVYTREARQACSNIRQTSLGPNPILRRLGRPFDRDHFLLYLEKAVFREITGLLLSINAVAWHCRVNHSEYRHAPVMYMSGSVWSRYLGDYAQERGVGAAFYWTVPRVDVGGLVKQLPRLAQLMRVSAKRLLSRPESHRIAASNGGTQPASPVIVTSYDGNGLTFDLSRNSDLFWVPFAKCAPGQLLVYCQQNQDPLDESKLEFLRTAQLRGIELWAGTGRNGTAPRWQPSLGLLRRWLRLCLHQVLRALRPPWSRPGVTWWVLRKQLTFLREYTYWREFFTDHQVKVSVSSMTAMPYQVAQAQAMAHLGGVCVSFQRSYSLHASLGLAHAGDVFLAFGPSGASLHRDSGSCLDYVVETGYVHDHAFAGVKEPSSLLRARLQGNGAEFIVSFFDENSGDDKRRSGSNEIPREQYRFLLTKLLEDPTLGLILKPKKPASLRHRLGDLADLLDRALVTGRCHVYEQGVVTSATLPCEASQTSDVAIGLLIGSTAALESRLSGTPTLLLDTLHLPYHPLYILGKGTVVFNGWDQLWKALSEYRQEPGRFPEFGNWSPTIEGLDSFRDGRAAERIGSFVGQVAEVLQRGGSAREAVEVARQRFAATWGEDKVVAMNGALGRHR